MRILKINKQEIDKFGQYSIVKSGSTEYKIQTIHEEKELLIMDKKEYVEDFLTGNLDNYMQSVIEDFDKVISIYPRERVTTESPQGTQVELVVSKTRRVNELPCGVFRLFHDRDRILTFSEMELDTHSGILHNPIDLSVYVEDLKKGTFGRKNKKGVLIYGPPGTGKTTSIGLLSKYCTEHSNTRMIFVSSSVSLESLGFIKDLFKDSYVIFVFEEITERIQRLGAKELLTFLDGEDSWNNCLTIATTNYPKDLEDNIIDRPGRFSVLIEVGLPTDEDIKKLSDKFDCGKFNIECLLGKNLSYDYASHILSKSKQTDTEPAVIIAEELKWKSKISNTFKSTKAGI